MFVSWRREVENAIFFAKNGFNVTAIDASDLGLKNLKIGHWSSLYKKSLYDLNLLE